MKKIVFVVALLLTGCGLAFAELHVDSSRNHVISAPDVGTEEVSQVKTKRTRPFVRCRNGTVSYSRQNTCVGRGGPLGIRPANTVFARAK